MPDNNRPVRAYRINIETGDVAVPVAVIAPCEKWCVIRFARMGSECFQIGFARADSRRSAPRQFPFQRSDKLHGQNHGCHARMQVRVNEARQDDFVLKGRIDFVRKSLKPWSSSFQACRLREWCRPAQRSPVQPAGWAPLCGFCAPCTQMRSLITFPAKTCPDVAFLLLHGSKTGQSFSV